MTDQTTLTIMARDAMIRELSGKVAEYRQLTDMYQAQVDDDTRIIAELRADIEKAEKPVVSEMESTDLQDRFREWFLREVPPQTLNHPEVGDFLVTMQRCEGKTPAELRAEAVHQRDQLIAVIEAMAANACNSPHGAGSVMVPEKRLRDAVALISNIKEAGK